MLLQQLLLCTDTIEDLEVLPGTYEIEVEYELTDSRTGRVHRVSSSTAVDIEARGDSRVLPVFPERGQYHDLINIYSSGGTEGQKVTFLWYDPELCDGSARYVLRVHPEGGGGPVDLSLHGNVTDVGLCGHQYEHDLRDLEPFTSGTNRWQIGRVGAPRSFSRPRSLTLSTRGFQIQEAATRRTAEQFEDFRIPVPFPLHDGVDYVAGFEAVRVVMENGTEPGFAHGFERHDDIPDMEDGVWLHLTDLEGVRSVRWQRRFVVADPAESIHESFAPAGHLQVPALSALPAGLARYTRVDQSDDVEPEGGFYQINQEILPLNSPCTTSCSIDRALTEIDQFRGTIPYIGADYLDVILQLDGAPMNSFNRWLNTTHEVLEMQRTYGCYHASRINVAMARRLGIPAIEVVLGSAHGYAMLWLPERAPTGPGGTYRLDDGAWIPFVNNVFTSGEAVTVPENIVGILKTTGWTGNRSTRHHSHWNGRRGNRVPVDYEWNGAIDRTEFDGVDLRLLITWPITEEHAEAFLDAPNHTEDMFQLAPNIYGMTYSGGGEHLLYVVRTDSRGLPIEGAAWAVPMVLDVENGLDLREFGGCGSVTFIPYVDPTLGSRYLVLELTGRNECLGDSTGSLDSQGS